jgi:hypothetical protein
VPPADPLADLDAQLTEHFGQRPARASLSFVGVDRIEVLRFEPIPGERAYVSLGMSRYPMTGAAEPVLAADGPRAELLLHLRDPQDEHRDVWRRVALLAAAPSVEGVVHRPGLSIDLGEPLTVTSACTGVLITASPIAPVDGVDILQVVPATSAELAWCRVRGADALRERWAAAGTDLLDLGRRTVALD